MNDHINDNYQSQQSPFVFQSFSKNLILPSANKQDAILTSGFSFKEDFMNNNQIEESSTMAKTMEAANSSIHKSIQKMTNQKGNDILYSGHFGPRNDISTIDSNVNPFQPIQEENCSFLNDESNSFLNFIDTRINTSGSRMIKEKTSRNSTNISKSSLFSKSFSNLCKSITITKKEKKMKTSEELELEKIQREKEHFKRLRQINQNNYQKIQKQSPLPFSKNLSRGNLLHRPFGNNKENQFLTKKRDESKENIDINSLSSQMNSMSISKRKAMGNYTKPLKKIAKRKTTPLRISFNKDQSISLEESFDRNNSKTIIAKNSIPNYVPINKPVFSIRQAFKKNSNIKSSNIIKKKAVKNNKENVRKRMNIVSFESIIGKK